MDVVFDGDSLLFQNPELLGSDPDLEKLAQLPTRATHIPFPLWGGEKTWVAPESSWPNGAPHPVLDSGNYSVAVDSPESMTMTSPICPQTELQIKRTIELEGEDRWTVRQQISNLGTQARYVGIWSVMMTVRPVHYFFAYSPGRQIEHIFGSTTVKPKLLGDFGQLDCVGMMESKIGIHPPKGLAAARIKTASGAAIWLATRTETPQAPDNYAHGHALEFYNSGHYDYSELEWHSPAEQIPPKQNISMDVQFQVFRENVELSPIENFRAFLDSGEAAE